MNRDSFLKYIDKNVKIKLRDGFVLYGRITDVFDDCLEFKSHQGSSLISFDEVTLVVQREGYWWMLLKNSEK